MTEMLDLAVTDHKELLEPGSLVGYRAVRWVTSSAKHERRQEIARFPAGIGSAPRSAARVVGSRHCVRAVCLSTRGGTDDIAGRGIPRAAGPKPLYIIALPRCAHGGCRAR